MANQALLCEEVADTWGIRGGFAAIEKKHVLDIPTLNETHEQSHGTRCITAKVVSQLEMWISGIRSNPEKVTSVTPVTPNEWNISRLVVTGTMEFHDFPYIYIYGMSSSQLTNSTTSFFRGVGWNHQPVSIDKAY